jgi:hypothetical protein
MLNSKATYHFKAEAAASASANSRQLHDATVSQRRNNVAAMTYERGAFYILLFGLLGVFALCIFFLVVLHCHHPLMNTGLDDEDFHSQFVEGQPIHLLHSAKWNLVNKFANNNIDQEGGKEQRETPFKRVNPIYGKGHASGSQLQAKQFETRINVDSIGEKAAWYGRLQDRYLPQWVDDGDETLLRAKIKVIRDQHGTLYRHHPDAAADFIDIVTEDEKSGVHCPLYPPMGYPKAWRIMDIVTNWNPDDTDPEVKDRAIYQGICAFDVMTDQIKIDNYRRAEVPFVVRNDPSVLRTVKRWNHPTYLRDLIGDEKHRTELSHSNHFMFWSLPRANQRRGLRQTPQGWREPTEATMMPYGEWLSHANVTGIRNDQDHWYYRLIGCGAFRNCDKHSSEYLFDELPFFKPFPDEEEGMYVVEGRQQKGIHCRFGMRGTIAENHWDGSRNMIALLSGARRYILSHPNQCPKLSMLPKDHPSGRHSDVDWSNPYEKLGMYPEFSEAMGNEVVLLPGDMLYLPTMWFHYIVSLDNINIQCNTRSGTTHHYLPDIVNCGQME